MNDPNASNVKQALYEELQNILSPNKEIRIAAEGRIQQLEFTEAYGVYLAEFIMNQSFEFSLRQLAAVMLKKYVENHWSEENLDVETTLFATDAAKKSIKNILPNGLYDPNSKIRTAVAYTISTIASYDWPHNWAELFDIIVKCLGGNEDSVHGAMQVLIEVTYDLNHQIAEVAPIILSEVYRIFEADTIYSVKTRSSAIEILTSLLKSINVHTGKQQQAALLNPVLPKFLEKLIINLIVPNGPTSNFALKTNTIKVFAFLVNNMPKIINQYMVQILQPIWQLLTHTADVYVKVTVNQTIDAPLDWDDTDDENGSYVTMVLQIFEFLHSIIECGKFKEIIKEVLIDLIYVLIVYMQMTEEQIETWSSDPEKFVEDEDEAGSDFAIRCSGQEVLLALGQEYEETILAALSEALTRQVNVAEAEKTAGQLYWWKIQEACMLAVGSFSELILIKPEQFNLSEYLNMIKNLMNLQLSPFFLGRCLWLMSRFVESDLFNHQSLMETLDSTLVAISPEKPIVLRIAAVRAIYGLCNTLSKSSNDRREMLLTKLNGYFDGLLNLFAQSKSTVLGLILEAMSVVLSFDVNFTASINNKAIPFTIAIFLKYHDDPFILDLVQNLLKILSQNKFCLQPLQEKIIPTLVSIFNIQGNTGMQEVALDVLQTIVRYSQPPLSNNLVEIAFPAAVQVILQTNDNSIMQSGGECLRAFISVSPEQICTYKNGEGLNYIMQVTTMLLNPMNTEYTASFIGRLVITIIQKAGTMLGENIDLLLKAVISKMQLVESLNVIMSLVMTFAHLILTQSEAVLNFLSTVPGPTGESAMQFVFNNWLSRQPLFYGSYERKVSTMALCKLFEHGVTTKDIRLTSVTIKDLIPQENNARQTRSQAKAVQAQWTTIPVLVKIYKLLINELSNLKEAKTAGEDDGDWTSDDENEGDIIDENSPKKLLKLFEDEEDEEDEDQLMIELMQDPIFQVDMEENLTKFLQNFSHDENFGVFWSHLTDAEKKVLNEIQVNCI